MIIAYTKSGKMLGKTSKAWDVFVTKELMRGYELSFCIANSDPLRQLIAPDVVFEVEGQKYDITSFASSSGTDNITVVDAEHVSYRLNNYVLPEQYSFANSAQTIINTMLSVSGADAEFTATAPVGIGGSISLQNDEPVSMRAGALAFKNASLFGDGQSGGLEVDYDNFTIRLSRRVGKDTGKVFKFGRDLVDLRRTWSKDNGATYDVDIAVLQRLEGGELEFGVGDDVTIEDAILGDTIKRRIISYTKCIDNPTLDKITLGVFVRDSADNSISMAVDMQAIGAGSVKEGKSYNNVDISHEYGFRSVSGDGLMRTINNGTDGYKIQRLVSGVWRTVWEAESSTGKTIAYNLAGNRKVELGGTDGLKMYRLSGSTWIEVAGLNSAGQLEAVNAIIGGTFASNDGNATLKFGTITSASGFTYQGVRLRSDGYNYCDILGNALGNLRIESNGNAILTTHNVDPQGMVRLYSGNGFSGSRLQLSDDSVWLVRAGEIFLKCDGSGNTTVSSHNNNGVRFVRDGVYYGANGTHIVGDRTITFVNGLCVGFGYV